MNLKAIFIDIDNTLLDFNEYVVEAMKNGFERFNIGKFEPYMADCFHDVNNNLWRQIEDGKIDFLTLRKIRWNKVFEILGYSYDGESFERYFRSFLRESAIPIEGAYEVLSYLKSKYIVCLASNGPTDQQTHRIELASMSRYIDYYFTSEYIGVSKPKREYFEKCFELLNENRSDIIKPNECLMIGDSLSSDIYGALEYGMYTCLYERGSMLNHGYLNNAHYTVEKLTDIIKLLEEEL
ncbi:HAD-IA family hydrolase [bacterium]|nr:HAD-IA family hydrolase [bacterium]